MSLEKNEWEPYLETLQKLGWHKRYNELIKHCWTCSGIKKVTEIDGRIGIMANGNPGIIVGHVCDCGSTSECYPAQIIEQGAINGAKEDDWNVVAEVGYPKEIGWYNVTILEPQGNTSYFSTGTLTVLNTVNPLDTLAWDGHRDESYWQSKNVIAWKKAPAPYQPKESSPPPIEKLEWHPIEESVEDNARGQILVEYKDHPCNQFRSIGAASASRRYYEQLKLMGAIRWAWLRKEE